MKTNPIVNSDMILLQDQFSDLYQPELLAEIQKNGKKIELKAGEILIDLGDYVSFIPLILEGSLRILREDSEGKELVLYHLGPGLTCAMSLTCCTPNAKSTIRAETEEPTVLIAVPISFLDDWSSQYLSWKQFIMRSYQYRFEDLIRTIDQIAFKKLDDRLERWLIERYERLDGETIHVTHQDIAQDLHSSREVISRLLKKMENQGRLTLGRNRIEWHG
jgi:CRP/FNR family transcriptional regulator